MADKPPRQVLAGISRTLLSIHRTLLDFQKQVHEQLHSVALSPHEVFRLASSDPSFEWLRTIMKLIVQIDEKVDDKDASVEGMAEDVSAQVWALFFGASSSDFRAHLDIALSRSPVLYLQLVELKGQLVLPN